MRYWATHRPARGSTTGRLRLLWQRTIARLLLQLERQDDHDAASFHRATVNDFRVVFPTADRIERCALEQSLRVGIDDLRISNGSRSGDRELDLHPAFDAAFTRTSRVLGVDSDERDDVAVRTNRDLPHVGA